MIFSSALEGFGLEVTGRLCGGQGFVLVVRWLFMQLDLFYFRLGFFGSALEGFS